MLCRTFSAGLKVLQFSTKTPSVQTAQYYAELFVAALKVLTVSRTEFISFLMGATAAKTLGVQEVKCCAELLIAGSKVLQFSCANIISFFVGPRGTNTASVQESAYYA